MPVRHALIALPLLAMACTEHKVGVYNTPPTVSITLPLDGSSYQPDVVIELEAVARDQQQDASTLDLVLISSLDGDLGSPTADSEGYVYFPVTQLTGGQHALTLEAIDAGGMSGQASVTIEVGYGNDNVGAPTVVLIGPGDNEQFTQAQQVVVVGAVTDDEQAWDTLVASVVSSRDGTLWEGNPASSGAVSVDLPQLSTGVHNLSLLVEDDDGNVGQASVNIEVLEDGRPTVEILSPSNSASFWTTDTVLFQGRVSDDVSDVENLEVVWDSDRQGVLHTGNPDSQGITTTSSNLAEGTHVITLAAVDEDANEGSRTVTVSVIDPLNHDNDRDGQTENQGDCNDNDPSIYTGATEQCDNLDNDCDGSVNETWWDTYEPNNSQGSPYDLGDVEGSNWISNSITISGLMLHEANDNDWFRFNADDDGPWDNPELTVSISGLGSQMFWVLELWDLNGGSPQLIQTSSGQGQGRLSLTWCGDLFSSRDDNFEVRVYATSWTSQGCSAPYSLQINRGLCL